HFPLSLADTGLSSPSPGRASLGLGTGIQETRSDGNPGTEPSSLFPAESLATAAPASARVMDGKVYSVADAGPKRPPSKRPSLQLCGPRMVFVTVVKCKPVGPAQDGQRAVDRYFRPHQWVLQHSCDGTAAVPRASQRA